MFGICFLGVIPSFEVGVSTVEGRVCVLASHEIAGEDNSGVCGGKWSVLSLVVAQVSVVFRCATSS